MKSGMTAIRAFIAIDLPAVLRARLDSIIDNLKNVSPGAVRWVPSKNIHLTLKFLGDISPANLQVLSKIIAAETQNCPPFDMEVGGVGAFPNDRRPRVVWVGVKAPSALENLQRSIEAETRRLGYTPEERPFSPHLTIGRVTHNAKPQDIRQLSETLVNLDTGNLGHVTVEKIFLFRSDLYPSGAVYRPLFSCNLTG